MVSKIIAPVLMLSLLTGCATYRVAGWDKKDQVQVLSAKEEKQMMKNALAHWEKRHVKADLEQSLELLEKISLSNPNNYEAFILLSRGSYIMAEHHVTSKEDKLKVWERGAYWGEKAMATNPEFKKSVTVLEKNVEDSLDTLTRAQVDAVYWSAVNLGKWGKLTGIATILKYKSRIKKMIQTVEKLDPNYFYGAVYRYWGVYYAVAPFFAGESLEKSLQNFEKSFKLQNDYLGTHVLFAEHYATRKGDKDLFKKRLKYVVDQKINVLKNIVPEQVLTQKKAKRMLANMESYF